MYLRKRSPVLRREFLIKWTMRVRFSNMTPQSIEVVQSVYSLCNLCWTNRKNSRHGYRWRMEFCLLIIDWKDQRAAGRGEKHWISYRSCKNITTLVTNAQIYDANTRNNYLSILFPSVSMHWKWWYIYWRKKIKVECIDEFSSSIFMTVKEGAPISG